jgi:DNA-binding response OmpR family regulator
MVAYAVRMTWPGCRVTVAGDGAAALREFAAAPPDLVILDVQIPPPNGFEVCRRIREVSSTPILMLTVRDTTPDKIRALDLGADDYITKPFDHLELVARLRALVRRAHGELVAARAALTVGDVTLDVETHMAGVRGEPVRLTATEGRLLEELMRHPGAVLSHRYLLEQVWGPAYTGDPSYLKVFIRRLRQKLGDDSNEPRYIGTEWGAGYRFILPR